MINLQNFHKLLKKGDYEIIGQAYPVAAVVGFIGYIIFYFSDKALGMYENFYLRIIVSVLFIQLIHFKKEFNFLKRTAVEVILAVCLPLFYSYFYFCTDQHTNWAAGFIFCGFTYGFLTGKAKYTLTIYPLFIVAGFYFYDRFFMDVEVGCFFSGMDIIILTVITAFFSSIMKLSLESVLLTYINAESRLIQLETDKNIRNSADHNMSLLKDLRKVKSLDAVSKLIAGLIEGFDEMIKVIQKNSYELKKQYDFDQMRQKRIDVVLEIVQKSSKLINSIAVFSPDRFDKTAIINVHNILYSVIKMISVNTGGNISIDTMLNAEDPTVFGNADLLEQAFFNICINAFQAMPDGGKLIIGTENRCIELSGDLQTNIDKRIIITFKDNGIGMDNDTKDSIFKPFFSTKESGSGRGLGLMMVNETVKRHHGLITVESSPSTGTTFILNLPTNR